jgi:N-carbamoyl-L-amino-acid hydrolase
LVKDLRVNFDRLKADIHELARIGRAELGGLRRYAYSPAYEEARVWLMGRMEDAGIKAHRDAAGNVFGRIGEASATVLSGSHIDTVPDGGPLDGAFGVLAALECLRVVQGAGVPLARALEAAAFVDEEGYYIDCLGSRAVAGLLSDSDICRAVNVEGNTLVQALRGAGLDPGGIGEAKREPSEIVAYVEIHIEQGPVLEQRGIPIGVVESIVGIDHTDVHFLGEPDHAGTTPMDMRRDAFMGAAHYATRARAFVIGEGGERARLTYGPIELQPQTAGGVVPYKASLRQEIRHPSEETLDRLVEGTLSLAREVADEFRLKLERQRVTRIAPAAMAPEVQTVIRKAAGELGLTFLDMPCGAGHDALFLVSLAPTGMIFVPSIGGKSHRPDEWTDWSDLESGANVLLQTLLRLAV